MAIMSVLVAIICVYIAYQEINITFEDSMRKCYIKGYKDCKKIMFEEIQIERAIENYPKPRGLVLLPGEAGA